MARARFSLEGDVGEIVISDPPLNLFGLELSRDLTAAAGEARDSDARAVLVCAEGENFSAGANVEMFLDRDEATARELLEEFMPAIRRFAEIDVPTVAAVRGLCLAAGLEVALSCDLIWAAEGTQLGLVEAVIGATPFGGGTQRLVARAGAGRAAEAVLTGRAYPAETMLEWGVVNRVVPAAELDDKVRSFAARLAAGPTVAHAATKRMIRLAIDEGVEAADEALPEAGAKVMASEDLQNGARTLLDEGPGKASFLGH
ncbi:MAG TPA: enoyl-CoA hydratase/isomerase family protein [Solirubrobacterales bacterium]|jgi:enoyl-CoA hydratase/carnithine racemase|nr:enoyl-CoA hydratase/isomerase family protein [Solirubrobacterales bacterium]